MGVDVDPMFEANIMQALIAADVEGETILED